MNDDAPDDGDGIGDTGPGRAGTAGGPDRSGDDGPELRRLGVLGGMSPASTVEYYCGLNAGVTDALGGHHSAPVLVDDAVFEELTHEVVREETREAFERVIDDLRDRGAEGVVLGCTELELLFDDAELWRDADGAGSVAAEERGDGRSGRGSAVPVPLFDTTALHVARGVEICLGRVDP